MSKIRVITTPVFREDMDRIKDKKQLELIYKSIEKIERMGKKAFKYLHVRGNFILGEVKFMRPPYRLYLVFDKKEDKFTSSGGNTRKNNKK